MMRKLGEKLRGARENKGVSTSEAARATKIKVQHIEALENEDFDKMAAPIYVKGFIKLYAEYLELDPDELLDQYRGANAPLTPDQIVGDGSAPKQKRSINIFSRSTRPQEEPREETEEGEGASAKGADAFKLLKELQARFGAFNLPHVNWKHILTVLGGLFVLVLII